jgi:hypothetical protein
VEGKTLKEINDKLVTQMEKIQDWCTENSMSINYDKTKVMYFHKNKDFTIRKESVEKITVRDYVIERVFSFKYLGITIDPCLTFNLHYDSVVKKLTNKIRYLRSFKRFFNKKIFKVMVNCHIHSVIDYALDIWAVQTDTKLDYLQRKIDRFLLEYEYPNFYKRLKCTEVDISKLRKSYDFLTVKQRRDYVILKNMYSRVRKDQVNVSQRKSCRTSKIIILPKFKSECFKNSLNYRSSLLWNSLPKNIDMEKGFANFLSSVKDFLRM